MQVRSGDKSVFLSTPSARRATRQLSGVAHHNGISIHALREEGDRPTARPDAPSQDFYPRPPRGGRRSVRRPEKPGGYFYTRPPRGGRRNISTLTTFSEQFLSTPSARRATLAHSTVPKLAIFLSTPSARRATSGSVYKKADGNNFYPRPPRGGRQQKQRQNLYFQTNYTTFCTNLEEL